MRTGEETDAVERVQEALDASEVVDARRVAVEILERRVVLKGTVASHEEASAAVLLAESVTEFDVSDELNVDRGLREGTAPRRAMGEPTERAEGEILVGDPDMLAGPETKIEGGSPRAYAEDIPWDPPDAPTLAPTVAEQRGIAPSFTGDRDDTADVSRIEPGKVAADLTREDLARLGQGGDVPSLDPEASEALGDGPPAGPGGVDSFGLAPDDETGRDRMPEPLPGAGPGVGAVGEFTQGGGSTGGMPAPKTGATGVDRGPAGERPDEQGQEDR